MPSRDHVGSIRCSPDRPGAGEPRRSPRRSWSAHEARRPHGIGATSRQSPPTSSAAHLLHPGQCGSVPTKHAPPVSLLHEARRVPVRALLSPQPARRDAAQRVDPNASGLHPRLEGERSVSRTENAGAGAEHQLVRQPLRARRGSRSMVHVRGAFAEEHLRAARAKPVRPAEAGRRLGSPGRKIRHRQPLVARGTGHPVRSSDPALSSVRQLGCPRVAPWALWLCAPASPRVCPCRSISGARKSTRKSQRGKSGHAGSRAGRDPILQVIAAQSLAVRKLRPQAPNSEWRGPVAFSSGRNFQNELEDPALCRRASSGLASADVRHLPRELEQHLRRPHGTDRAVPSACVGQVENSACGDRLRLGVELDGSRIARAGFEGRGCSASLALASLACATIEGREIGELPAVAVELRARFGKKLAPMRRHALDMVERALTDMLARARERCHPESPPQS